MSYHNHDDHHHAIFGGHALPSVHNGASFFMNSHYNIFYNSSISQNHLIWPDKRISIIPWKRNASWKIYCTLGIFFVLSFSFVAAWYQMWSGVSSQNSGLVSSFFEIRSSRYGRLMVSRNSTESLINTSFHIYFDAQILEIYINLNSTVAFWFIVPLLI